MKPKQVKTGDKCPTCRKAKLVEGELGNAGLRPCAMCPNCGAAYTKLEGDRTATGGKAYGVRRS